MRIKNRNGVLGLETARAVMVTFLVLAVTAVAVILSLTALNDSVGNTIDNVNRNHVVTNESDINGGIAFANLTGYTLRDFNSTWTSVSLTEAWSTSAGAFNVSVPLANLTLSSSTGVLTNATLIAYDNLSISYSGVFVEDTGRTDNIISNVSDGLETFFGSTGTIFSILIVVVIILAISIIIWAVGRFGQKTEETTL